MICFDVKGKRPYHVVGRKRIRCCGIESSPILASFGGRNVDDDDSESDSRLPQKGEKVDSINYYSRELTVMNEKMARMQHDKIELAMKGNDSVRASQWIAHAVDRVSTAAETTLSSNTQDDGLITGFGSSPGRRKPLLLTLLDRIGVDFISGGITYIQQNIDEVVDSVVGATMSSTGFITFKDLHSVTCAAKTPLFHKPDVLIANMAPESRDIIWENAHVNLGWSRGREWTANMLLGVGAILWSIPVASIQALATADQIATVPGMGWLETLDGGNVAAFVNGYLPVVLLLTIIMVLPHIFYAVALHYEDRKTRSDVQKSITGRYFYYQLANIYITVTAGSILDSLNEIIEHPTNILAILGKSLPNVVGYFATCISPIILPVVAAFFLGAWLVYKNQILIVYSPHYESGGTMFPMALMTFPLPVITIKMMDVFKNLYEVPGKNISVERAVELDMQRNAASAFSQNLYRQPVLREKSAEVLGGSSVRRFASGGDSLGSSELTNVVKVNDSGKIV
eukprot:scaffold16004_cov202-Skeletonema_marinoi.AAC.2